MYKYFISYRYIKSRLISIFSILAVAIGVMVLVVVLSVMDGFKKEFKSRLQGSLSDIIISVHNRSKYEDLEQVVRKVPEIEACSPHLNGLILLGD